MIRKRRWTKGDGMERIVEGPSCGAAAGQCNSSQQQSNYASSGAKNKMEDGRRLMLIAMFPLFLSFDGRTASQKLEYQREWPFSGAKPGGR
mmetsp:Transcript_1848/g.3474  ORF Transcript_1848/g.3474 Transcript_1848/m.3474 type:complete len:91 (-) Transcript_1848:2283-2555(-)